jgi:hypothetical protein
MKKKKKMMMMKITMIIEKKKRQIDHDEDDEDSHQKKRFKLLSDDEEQQQNEKINALNNVIRDLESKDRTQLFKDLGIQKLDERSGTPEVKQETRNRNNQNLINAFIQNGFVFDKNVTVYDVYKFIENLKKKK